MSARRLEGKSVAVTGASGFVGPWVVAELVRHGARVIACVRESARFHWETDGVVHRKTGDLQDGAAWVGAFEGCMAVLHLAGRAHFTREDPAHALAQHRDVNVAGTRNVATEAVRAGVQRIVYLSSIGVEGSRSEPGQPLRVSSKPSPSTPYARSKLEAEESLRELEVRGKIEVTCIRPPMVYGPGAPGNLASLSRALRRTVPLPLGAIRNKRAFVAAPTLAECIVECASCPAAAGRTLNVTDGEDVSTTTFIRRLRAATGGQAPLVPVAPKLLRAALTVMGRRQLAASLLDDLEVDVSETTGAIGWKPSVAMEAAMRRMYALPASHRCIPAEDDHEAAP